MEHHASIPINIPVIESGVRPSKARVLERVPSVLFGILLFFMDILTIGGKGLTEALTNPELLYLSSTFFALGLAVSQTVFYFCSSLPMGVMTSPISESFMSFRSLSTRLGQLGLQPEEHFATTMVCIMLSTALTGAVYLGLYFFGAEKVLKKIPAEIGTALFFTVGWLCLKVANETLWEINSFSWVYTILFNLGGLGLWLLAKYTAKRWPALERYTYLIIVGTLIGVFYLGVALAGGSLSQLVAEGILPQVQSYGSLKASWLSNLSFGSIRFGCIPGELFALINIALLNLIHFPINLASIEKGCGTKANMKQELLTHGIANLVGSLAGGYPIYILSSSTIALNNPMRSHRVDSIVIGGLVLALYFMGQQLIALIPRPCVDLLLLFVGLDIIWDVAGEIFSAGPFLIGFCSGVAVLCLYTNRLEIGVILGIIIIGAKKAVEYYRKRSHLGDTSFAASTLPIRE